MPTDNSLNDYLKRADMSMIDMDQGRIPLRELFINTSLISDAFSTHSNVSEALKQILDELNKASNGVFNLKLISGRRDGSSLCIIDDNF